MVKCPMLNIYPQTSEMFLDIRFLVVIWASVDTALVFAAVEDAVWSMCGLLQTCFLLRFGS